MLYLAALYIINIKIRLTIKKAQVLTAINAYININMTKSQDLKKKVVVVVDGRPCHALVVISLPRYQFLSPAIPGAGLATVFNVRVQIAGLTDRRYSGDSSPMRHLLREVACQRPAVSSCR